jgi:hypothetical protein
MTIVKEEGTFYYLLDGWCPTELDATNFLDAEIEADSKYGAKTLLEILDNDNESL